MILILGGAQSGRHIFFDSLGIPVSDCHEVVPEDARAFAEEKKPAALSYVCVRLASFRVVIAQEMGLGIIPLEKEGRTAREENGRLNIALASLADAVVMMTAGIPRVIKGNLSDALKKKPRFLMVFRHGATEANLLKRYAGGATDLAVCDEGRRQVLRAKESLASYVAGVSPSLRESLVHPDIVYVSPMKRCMQTAETMYPAAEKRIVNAFREMDIGLFENRSADELLSDASTRDLYQQFIDSGATIRCPASANSAGESIAEFLERTEKAFRTLVQTDGERTAMVIVAHGGTQMSLFSQFCAWKLEGQSELVSSYYGWQTDCGGFRLGVMR